MPDRTKQRLLVARRNFHQYETKSTVKL